MVWSCVMERRQRLSGLRRARIIRFRMLILKVDLEEPESRAEERNKKTKRKTQYMYKTDWSIGGTVMTVSVKML